MPIPTIPAWGNIITKGWNNLRDIWKASKERYNNLSPEQKKEYDAKVAEKANSWATDKAIPGIVLLGEMMQRTSLAMSGLGGSEAYKKDGLIGALPHMMMPAFSGTAKSGTKAILKATEKGINAAGKAIKTTPIATSVFEQSPAKLKYYGPAMGKSTAAKTNPLLIDLDTYGMPEYNALAKKYGYKDWREMILSTKGDYNAEYKQLIKDQIARLQADPANNGKTILVSNASLLNPNSGIKFDAPPVIPDRATMAARNHARHPWESIKHGEEWWDALQAKGTPLKIDNRFVSDIEYLPPRAEQISFVPQKAIMLPEIKLEPDKYWYVGHQTGSANFPSIQKYGLKTTNGLNGTATWVNQDFLNNFMNGSLKKLHLSHEGADGLVLMKFPKSQFPKADLDDISFRLMDLGESTNFEIPPKYITFLQKPQVELTGDLFAGMEAPKSVFKPTRIGVQKKYIVNPDAFSGVDNLTEYTIGNNNQMPMFKVKDIKLPEAPVQTGRSAAQKHESFMKGLNTYSINTYGIPYENLKPEYKTSVEQEYRNKFKNKQ